MDSTTHISELLQKALRREATAGELAELMDWMGTDASGQRTKWLSDYLGLSMELVPPGDDYNYAYWNTLADKVLQADRPVINPSLYDTTHTPTVIPLQLPKWRRYAAVAAILVLVLASTWFFILNHRQAKEMAQTPTPSIPYKNDKAPGRNKATLTLADHSTINLDDAANGKLAQQGNAAIIKSNGGQLAYNTTNEKTTEVLYNTLTTPRGGQYQLVLPDGSKVWLNAASSIRYPTAFSGSTRQVDITGEAYFEISKDANRSFTVRVGSPAGAKGEIKVLGTHFNVNAYDDEPAMRTTLLEGAVRLTKDAASAVLKPGQQAQLQQAGEIKLVSDPDIEQTMAWKNGLFAFNGADIHTIMRQISRWYDVDVVFERDIRGSFHVEMSRNTNVSNVFRILETTGAVHFKIDGKKVIVIQ